MTVYPHGDALVPASFDAQTDERLRGISIYAVPLEEALALARQDPMVRAGRLAIDGARWLTASGAVRFGATG
jgi:hypothetical protein